MVLLPEALLLASATKMEKVMIQILSDESITVSSTAIGLTTVPQGANYALIEVESQPIRYWGSGTPTATVGHNGEIGDTIKLTDFDTLANFRVIRRGGSDSTLRVSYGKER